MTLLKRRCLWHVPNHVWPTSVHLFAVISVTLVTAQAADLSTRTTKAFDVYLKSAETGMTSPQYDLRARASPANVEKLRSGEVIIDAVSTRKVDVPDGMIHDWAGAVFVPDTTIPRVLDFLQNYNNHKNVYKPEVLDSRLLARDGNHFRVYLRLMKKKVITVVLNTEYDVIYAELAPKLWYSRSYSTRITEARDAGPGNEKELPPGTGHGFLWRLNAYWHFLEKDDGVYIECRAISLTRDIPFGLAWIVEPMVTSLPRESLISTLRSTRSGLTGR